MPKNITISTEYKQVAVDGELFSYVLADQPTVEKIAEDVYRVTLVTYAQNVTFTHTILAVDEYGEPITADLDPFFDQDCPDFVYENLKGVE